MSRYAAVVPCAEFEHSGWQVLQAVARADGRQGKRGPTAPGGEDPLAALRPWHCSKCTSGSWATLQSTRSDNVKARN